MRYIICALMLVTGIAMAAEPVQRFDQAQFEQRFRKADKGNKGKLSRAEAYAEFPRMPEFFDEIDRNKDNFITLEEVRQARERRVNAAIEASNPARRYGSVELGRTDSAAAAGAPAIAEQPQQFSSKAEERRYYRMEYYELLERDTAKARERGEPVSDSPSTPLLKKSF